MLEPINIGILGLGRAGWQMQVNELESRSSMFRIGAVCDLVEDRLQAAEEKIGCATYSRIEDLLANSEIEMVSVATRSCDHLAHASAALRAGKDVFLEKPMCANYRDAKALCDLAESLGRRLYVRHNRRFEPAFQHIREIIDSGVLGEVFEIKLRRLSYQRRDDWQTLKEFGGGQLLNWGAHVIDHALRFLGGPPSSVWSDLKCIAAAGDAEDHVRTIMKGASGMVVDLEISGGAALGEPVYTVCGSRGALTSDEQTIHLHHLKPELVLQRREAHRETPGTGIFSTEDPLEWVDETISVAPKKRVEIPRIWDALWSAVREGVPYPITNEEALQVMQVVEEVRSGTRFEQ